MTAEAVSLERKLGTFSDLWSPRIVAAFNGHVKVRGEFVWHSHAETDDLFLVLEGRPRIDLRGDAVALGPGEPYVVPRGVEHRRTAEEETHLLLLEPAGTPNTDVPATAAQTARI